MDSGRKQDIISSLSDMILVLIIANLPFKEAARTCTLSKRWKNLHRKNTNVTFKESDFVSVSNDEEFKRAARVSFVQFMVDWISKFCGEGIERFQLCFSKPVGFETEITSLLEFAVSKEVKNLVVDFSDPSWVTSNEAVAEGGRVFKLPECVYNLINLESVTLFACQFNPFRLASAGPLRTLCFGWIELGNIIMTLLSNSPLVESLTLQNCWNVGLVEITRYNNRLRELIIENCDFSTPFTTLDVLNIQIFRYIGRVYCFRFMGENRTSMKEAYLDYGLETEDGGPVTTLLFDLLNDLSSARKLTVCSYLIQMIQYFDDPDHLLPAMETKELVIKTSLRANELFGVRLMINGCSMLETLALEMVPHRNVAASAIVIDPNYWVHENTNPCLENTLKVVNWKNFSGILPEVDLLKYLIRNGNVLEKVELRLPNGHGQVLKMWADYLVNTIGNSSIAASTRLWMFVNSD